MSTFCVEYFLKFISSLNPVLVHSEKMRSFINSHLADIASIHLKTTRSDESSSFILNSYASLTIAISSDFIDELFLSYLMSAIEHSKRPCTEHIGTPTDEADIVPSEGLGDNFDPSTTLIQGQLVAPDLKSSSLQLLLPLANQLRDVSSSCLQLKYNSSLFNDLNASVPCIDNSFSLFNRDVIKRLWMYCSRSVSLHKMKIMSAIVDFCFIKHINEEFVNFCMLGMLYYYHNISLNSIFLPFL